MSKIYHLERNVANIWKMFSKPLQFLWHLARVWGRSRWFLSVCSTTRPRWAVCSPDFNAPSTRSTHLDTLELLVGPKDLTQRPDLASAPNRNPATRNPLPWDQCRLWKEHFGVSGSRNGQQVDTAVMSAGLWPNIVVDTKGWKLAGMQSGSGFSKNTLLLTLCHLKHHRIFLLIASTPLKCPPEPPNAAFWSLLNVTAASTLHLLVIRRCGV